MLTESWHSVAPIYFNLILIFGFREESNIFASIKQTLQIFPRSLSCFLTPKTASRLGPGKWSCWPALPPPPVVGGRSASEASPGGRWCGWVLRRSGEVWWHADRCACCHAWSRPERPPWNWPGNCDSRTHSLWDPTLNAESVYFLPCSPSVDGTGDRADVVWGLGRRAAGNQRVLVIFFGQWKWSVLL